MNKYQKHRNKQKLISIKISIGNLPYFMYKIERTMIFFTKPA